MSRLRVWRRRDPLMCCTGYLEDRRRRVATLGDVREPPPDPATREALARAFRELRPQ